MAVSGPKAKQTVQIGASYNGPGASTACNFFPSALSASPVPTFCKAPRGATITLKSDHLATIETALRGAGMQLVDLRFLYWYPALGSTAEGVDCALPASEKHTCEAILTEAEGRIRQQLNVLAKKYASSPTTTASTAAAPQQLTATVMGSNGVCLPDVKASSGLAQAPTAADTFDLRRPGNGVSEGNVLAVTTDVQNTQGGCSIVLNFTVGTGLGFYVVVDETAGLSWGPFDSHNLPSEGWALSLTYSGTG